MKKINGFTIGLTIIAVPVIAVVVAALVVAGLDKLADIEKSRAEIASAQAGIIEAEAQAYAVRSEADQDTNDAQFFRDAAWWAILSPWLAVLTVGAGYFVTNVRIGKIIIELGSANAKLRAVMKGWGK